MKQLSKNKTPFKDITPIVNNYLCHSCGSCSSICPTNVISYQETNSGYIFPKIDYSNCIECELCSIICPGVNFGVTLEEKQKTFIDPFIGNISDSLIGKSKDTEIYNNSQSGGITTDILLQAIEKGIIDCAIVAIMKSDANYPMLEVKLVESKQELIESQKSKYLPVPLNESLRIIKEKKLKFAMVGLSCHIHGLYNLMDKQKSIQKLHVFNMGLICDKVMTYRGMEYLIWKENINDKSKVNFIFRDKKAGGYPGNVVIETPSNKKILNKKERMKVKDFFTPLRCKLCYDKLNTFSDITVGDPHGIKDIDKNGETLILVRTKIGAEILNKLNFNVKTVNIKDAMRGQKIEDKKRKYKGYINSWKKMNQFTPMYGAYLSFFFKDTEYLHTKNFEKDLNNTLKIAKNNSKEEIFNIYRKTQSKIFFLRIVKMPMRFLNKLLKGLK